MWWDTDSVHVYVSSSFCTIKAKIKQKRKYKILGCLCEKKLAFSELKKTKKTKQKTFCPISLSDEPV